MNLILIDPDEISPEGTVSLADRRAQHLREVIDVQVGQELRAGVVRGPRAAACVLSLGPPIVLGLTLGGEVEIPSVDLVLALPRPKALSRIVQAAASFGVRRIDIINTWRVDASYFASPKLSTEALALDARLGCEQGQITYVPEVSSHRLFVPYVEQVLGPRLQQEPGRRLVVAHPHAAVAVEAVLAPGWKLPTAIAIGPDGGFVERELASLESIGGSIAHFGSAILRSESAVVAILSQLDLLRRLVRQGDQ